MSSFAVRRQIVRSVEDHPNADRLSLVSILGYTAISAKTENGRHRYSPGDWVIYIPEDAILPERLLRRLGLWNEAAGKGTLSGAMGARVRPLKLRGVYSEGLLLPIVDGVVFDGENEIPVSEDDMAAALGIQKYEPEIPTSMSGEVFAAVGVPAAYDFDAIESQPDLFTSEDVVNVSEKIHGTFCQIGIVSGEYETAPFFVSSKGLGSRGLVFKDVPNNDHNVYVRTFRQLRDGGKLDVLRSMFPECSVRIFGEIFGPGVQDLNYGLKSIAFRIFDIQVGQMFLPTSEVREVAARLGLDVVPTLYEGPYDWGKVLEVRDGKTTLGGDHIREGVVIRATSGPRRIAKAVSPDYKLRKKGTEFR